MLSLVRSTRNTFASINRTPSEVLSLIPDYLSDAGEGLITLTHVCRGWREIFTSRSPLWASLDCQDVHKTLTYLERSKSFPLDIHLKRSQYQSYRDDALLLAVPHVSRLGSLTVDGTASIIPALIRRFSCPTPLLKKLEIDVGFDHPPPTFPATLFGGDLSSLRLLSLAGFATSLPWRNLANLTTLKLFRVPETVNLPSITQLLDFFESAPLLSDIELRLISVPSNPPPGRVVPIPHLKKLTLLSCTPSFLLKYLSIPIGASLVLNFPFGGESSPILDCLPGNFDDLKNLSHITTISLLLDEEANYVRFHGPSGELHLCRIFLDEGPSLNVVQSQTFRSFKKFNLSNTQRLAVTMYDFSPRETVDSSPIFQTLLLMDNLRILTLIECKNLPFIHALNPEKNNSGTVACPNLEDLTLYIKKPSRFNISELREMASVRAGRHAKCPSLTIVSLREMLPKEEVFTLREYFPHVEYKVDVVSPRWDTLPGDPGDWQGEVVTVP